MTAPGTNFDAPPEEIDRVGTRCDNTADNLDGELGKLRAYVALLAGSWLGATSTAFTALMENYDRKAKELTAALREIGGGLHKNANAYRLTEATNTKNVNAVTIG